MLNAERLKKVQIHQARLRSRFVSFFSGAEVVAVGWAAAISATLRLHRRCAELDPRQVQVVENGYEGADNRHADERHVAVDDQDPADQGGKWTSRNLF